MRVQCSSPALGTWGKGLTVWSGVPGGQPFQGIPVQGDLYHLGCPRAGWCAKSCWDSQARQHRAGDWGPRHGSRHFQVLLYVPTSLMEFCRVSVEPQWSWWRSSLRAIWDDSTRQNYGIEGDCTEKCKLEMLLWEHFTVGFRSLLTAHSDLD